MKKGRWPKSERKRLGRRAEFEAATEYKLAMERRDGAAGPASEVRRIDPNSPEGKEIASKYAASERGKMSNKSCVEVIGEYPVFALCYHDADREEFFDVDCRNGVCITARSSSYFADWEASCANDEINDAIKKYGDRWLDEIDRGLVGDVGALVIFVIEQEP